MRTRIDFPEGMSALGGIGSCSLERFTENALGVLLESESNPDDRLLLGVVRRAVPGFSIVLTEEERVLMQMKEDEDCEVFCRMRIPGDDPAGAGFDLARLVLVCLRTGRGVEKHLHGQPLLPLVTKREGQMQARHGAKRAD